MRTNKAGLKGPLGKEENWVGLAFWTRCLQQLGVRFFLLYQKAKENPGVFVVQIGRNNRNRLRSIIYCFIRMKETFLNI